MSKGGTITLLANGKKLGESRVEKTAGFKYSLYEGQDIGEDSGSPVDFDYTPPFKFTGKIDKLTFKLGPGSVALAAFVTASLGFSSSRTRLCRAGREKSQPSKSRRKSKKEARSSGFRDHRPPDRDRCLCLWTPYLGTAFQA